VFCKRNKLSIASGEAIAKLTPPGRKLTVGQRDKQNPESHQRYRVRSVQIFNLCPSTCTTLEVNKIIWCREGGSAANILCETSRQPDCFAHSMHLPIPTASRDKESPALSATTPKYTIPCSQQSSLSRPLGISVGFYETRTVQKKCKRATVHAKVLGWRNGATTSACFSAHNWRHPELCPNNHSK